MKILVSMPAAGAVMIMPVSAGTRSPTVRFPQRSSALSQSFWEAAGQRPSSPQERVAKRPSKKK